MLDRFKALLAPPEQKASRTARLLAFQSGGRARWELQQFNRRARRRERKARDDIRNDDTGEAS